MTLDYLVATGQGGLGGDNCGGFVLAGTISHPDIPGILEFGGFGLMVCSPSPYVVFVFNGLVIGGGPSDGVGGTGSTL
jgi:hypothetical protein